MYFLFFSGRTRLFNPSLYNMVMSSSPSETKRFQRQQKRYSPPPPKLTFMSSKKSFGQNNNNVFLTLFKTNTFARERVHLLVELQAWWM